MNTRCLKSEIASIHGAIGSIVADAGTYTVRKIFYQRTSLGFIAKTEGEYKIVTIPESLSEASAEV